MINTSHYTVRISFSCQAKDIVYVNSVLDSYGNLGLMRTINKNGYNCAVFSTEGVYKTVLEVLEALKKEGAGIIDVKTEVTENVDFE